MIKEGNFMPIEVDKVNFDQHYLVKTSDDIKTITAPLKQFGIMMFDHFRIYDDNSALDLTTVPEFCELYAKEKLFIEGCAGNFDDYHEGYYFWDTLSTPKIHKALEQKCGVGHGVTIVKTYKHYTDHFYIAGDINNPAIKNFFITQKHIIESFIQYFYIKAEKLINNAREHSYIFPNNKKECKEMLETPCKIELITDGLIKNLSLTPREMECVKESMKGSSAKMVANQLNISPKTVERHLENIRAKLGVKNKLSLFKKLSKLLPEIILL